MAEIYNGNGNEITVGLQSSSVCDEAMIAAKSIARDYPDVQNRTTPMTSSS